MLRGNNNGLNEKEIIIIIIAQKKHKLIMEKTRGGQLSDFQLTLTKILLKFVNVYFYSFFYIIFFI